MLSRSRRDGIVIGGIGWGEENGGKIRRRGNGPKMPVARIGAVMAGRRRAGTRMMEVGTGTVHKCTILA